MSHSPKTKTPEISVEQVLEGIVKNPSLNEFVETLQDEISVRSEDSMEGKDETKKEKKSVINQLMEGLKSSPRDESKREKIQKRGPRLIKPLNKYKQTAIVGEMVFDPINKVWRGNEEALDSFPQQKNSEKRDISPSRKHSVQMEWDPVQKKWIGNEKDLERFDKKGLRLIKSSSQVQIVGSMKFDPESRSWVCLEPDNEIDPFSEIGSIENDDLSTTPRVAKPQSPFPEPNQKPDSVTSPWSSQKTSSQDSEKFEEKNVEADADLDLEIPQDKKLDPANVVKRKDSIESWDDFGCEEDPDFLEGLEIPFRISFKIAPTKQASLEIEKDPVWRETFGSPSTSFVKIRPTHNESIEDWTTDVDVKVDDMKKLSGEFTQNSTGQDNLDHL